MEKKLSYWVKGGRRYAKESISHRMYCHCLVRPKSSDISRHSQHNRCQVNGSREPSGWRVCAGCRRNDLSSNHNKKKSKYREWKDETHLRQMKNGFKDISCKLHHLSLACSINRIKNLIPSTSQLNPWRYCWTFKGGSCFRRLKKSIFFYCVNAFLIYLRICTFWRHV